MDTWCDSGLCGEKMVWELLGDTLFIDGEGFMDNYLPGNTIWEPMAWYVRSVVISNGVKSIGDYAFSGFTKLVDVSIPKSVRRIGKDAFADCTNLKEITIAKENMSYYMLDGMLIEKIPGRIIWPPEKAGTPLSRFAVNENDCVFRIETRRRGSGERWESGIGSFGDEDTLIEIRESGGAILDIECIYLNPTLHEPNLFLPDYRSDPELGDPYIFCCPDYEYGIRMPCVVNVVRDKMEIIFSENLDDVSCCHVEGRVEYYCTSTSDVVFIRISDLTEEEYRVLR